MTSAHSMFTRLLRCRPLWRTTRRSAGVILVLLSIAACRTQEKLQPPSQLSAPYDRPQVWAIVPFVNESGVSIVRSDRIADLFAQQAEDIDGIATVPVNRVIFAMRRLDMPLISTANDAATLMNVLGVDGLIVGTVTAYDPYPPPKLGAAVQLFRRDHQDGLASVNPIEITRATTDHLSLGAAANPGPVALASGIFDASNHQTLAWLDAYATGRAEPNSAYGKRIYLVNMELYTQFVAHRLLHDLLVSERNRLQPMASQVNAR